LCWSVFLASGRGERDGGKIVARARFSSAAEAGIQAKGWRCGWKPHPFKAKGARSESRAFSKRRLIESSFVLPVSLVRPLIRSLDWLAGRLRPADPRPLHQRIGTRGEEDAYFHLRQLGYAIVARNYRSPRCRGEIDLIGWDGDVLCFIEVKTRTSHHVKAAAAAVDRHKRRELAEVAREYRRLLPPTCQWRIDIVSVYYDRLTSRPQIEVFRNASLAA
jgi:putative endonuclease